MENGIQTKADVSESFAVVVQYPLIVVKIDDKVRSLIDDGKTL